MHQHLKPMPNAVTSLQGPPETPATTSIMRYCASGYAAGEHWNERVCTTWSPADVRRACMLVDEACAPGGDPEAVLQGLRALAEMLQVELPGPYGLDLLVEELVLLPRDLLEDAIRGVARGFSAHYRRFPTLSEIRSVVADELRRRHSLKRSVRALARDHAARCDASGPFRLTDGHSHDAPRPGGLRPVAACLSAEPISSGPSAGRRRA